jgi:hypothetical protein
LDEWSKATSPDAETTHVFRIYWAVVAVIPFVMAAFLSAFFFLGRALTRSDEREMGALFTSLFSNAFTAKST